MSDQGREAGHVLAAVEIQGYRAQLKAQQERDETPREFRCSTEQWLRILNTLEAWQRAGCPP